jgi:lipopolysaccharide export system permease protein
MQFVWKYVDDMVGKGVEMRVLGQLFFYAAVYLTPMALILAVLLASLMTFGNLGEHFELLAIKAAGISLIRIMKPLIIAVIFISGLSYYVQNDIGPKSQAKLWTIMLSLRQKSPELDIPEGSFYKDVPGYNIYVRQKSKTGMLYDVKIYDFTKGFDDLVVIAADSGKLRVSDDKKYTILTMYSGELFGNMDDAKSRNQKKKITYRREKFGLRELLIAFDTNLNMEDESIMQNRDISKDRKELRMFIDSVSVEIDSVTRVISPNVIKQSYAITFNNPMKYIEDDRMADSTFIADCDLFYQKSSTEDKIRIIERAKAKSDQLNNDFTVQMYEQSSIKKQVVGHRMELHKKFTVPLACLLFFFIGAPLGAIIRKGGLGMPTVLSVFLFIFYYTVDIFGSKMAKQGVWPVWEGMWLSTFLLAAFGIFFTYMAVNDSVIFNPDAWKEFLQKLIGKREVRIYAKKEVIMVNPNYEKDVETLDEWNTETKHYLNVHKKLHLYTVFWKNCFNDPELYQLVQIMDSSIEDLLNSNENLIIMKLMDYPVIKPIQLPFLNKSSVRWFCAVFVPAGIIIYSIYLLKQKQIKNDLRLALKINDELRKELVKQISNNNNQQSIIQD